MEKEMRQYWEELNKEYGLDLKLDIDLEPHTEEIQANLIFGMSFDGAVQHTFLDKENEL